MSRRFYLKFLLTGTFVIVTFFLSYAQGNKQEQDGHDDENYSIQWISQYPITSDKKESKEKNNMFSENTI